MTVTTTSSEKDIHPVQRRLKERAVDVVAIVDDAFDTPTRENTLPSELQEFVTEVNADPALQAELVSHSLLTDGQELEDANVNDEFLLRLWRLAEGNKLDALAPKCANGLFSSRYEKLKDVRKLTEYLKDLGIDVRHMSKLPESPGELDGSIKILFLDYFLGPDASTAHSQQFAETIRRQSPNTFMVLMSSKENLSATADLFRSQSKLLRNLFDFAEKKDLTQKEKLLIKLESWLVGLPSRLRVRSFVNALETSIQSVTSDFLDKVRSLNLEDYAFTQKLSLQAEGQPLGEYMLWLHSNLIAELFSKQESIIHEVRELDRLVMEELLPFANPPSRELAEIYNAAICQQLTGGWKMEKVKLSVGEHEREFELPHIELGDILIKDGSSPEVYMVINAACDLIFSQQRTADPDQSILLVPGTLYSLGDQRGNSPVRTELFLHRGNQYRIVWDLDRVRAEKHAELRTRLSGYEPLARLRMPYALEVQRAFSAKLTRIGMPVAPPFYHPVPLEVWGEGDKGKCKLLMKIPADEGAVILHTKKKNSFILTIKCIERIMHCLDEVASLPEPSNRNAAGSTRRELVQRLKQNFVLWQEYMTKPTDVPEAKISFRDQISIHRNEEITAERDFKEVSKERFLLALNLRCGDGCTSKEPKEPKDGKDTKPPKDSKNLKGQKGLKESRSSGKGAGSGSAAQSPSPTPAESRPLHEEPAHV